MVTKRFDPALHKENDGPAKQSVLSWLASKGIDGYVNENPYGIDIVIGKFEVERRPLWSGESFPFSTIHIPLRKKKFFQAYSIKYCIVNKEGTHMLMVDSKDIIKYAPIEVPNKYVAHQEEFYDVPRHEFQLINLGVKNAKKA